MEFRKISSSLKRLLATPTLKANVIANFIGNGYGALLGIIFVPVYLHYIGAEGYGLIGIFTSLQVVLSLLDNGLSTTLNKEIARLSATPDNGNHIRNFVKTLSAAYWIIAAAIGVIALTLSPVLANYWLHPKQLTVHTVTVAFFFLSISMVFQFISSFYGGGLLGLQKQVIFNILRVLFSTLKSVGAVFILMYVSRTVIAFFAWNTGITILQALTFRLVLWHQLPAGTEKAIFRKEDLYSIKSFAFGMTAIGLTSVLLTQVDTVILSKILSLSKFGYYTLSYTIGSVAYMICGPVSQSYFPKFGVLYAENNMDELKRIYHQGCQLVTALVLPFSLFLATFSKEILLVWTHNNTTVENTWQITSIVTLAVALHCLMFMPYTICLTYNNTKLALYTNIAILIVLIPSTIFFALKFGGIGGAFCWLVINIIYVIVNPIMIHNRFLKGEAAKWYWTDTIKPVLGCTVVLLLTKLLISHTSLALYFKLCIITSAGFIGFLVTLMSCKNFNLKLTFKK